MAFVRTFHGYERTFSLALTRALSPSPPRPPRLVAVLRQAQPPGGAGRQRGARRPRGRAGRRAHKDVEAHNQAVPLRGRRAAVPPRRVGARAHWRRCPACRRGPPRVGGLRLSCRDRRAPTGAAPARPRARAPARRRAPPRGLPPCGPGGNWPRPLWARRRRTRPPPRPQSAALSPELRAGAEAGAEAQDAFADGIHFRPYVYEELNHLLLDTLCPAP